MKLGKVGLVTLVLLFLGACAGQGWGPVPEPAPDHRATPSMDDLRTVSFNITAIGPNGAGVDRNVSGVVKGFDIDGTPALMRDKKTGRESPLLIDYNQRTPHCRVDVEYDRAAFSLTFSAFLQGFGGDSMKIMVSDDQGTLLTGAQVVGVREAIISGDATRRGVATIVLEVILPAF